MGFLHHVPWVRSTEQLVVLGMGVCACDSSSFLGKMIFETLQRETNISQIFKKNVKIQPALWRNKHIFYLVTNVTDM